MDTGEAKEPEPGKFECYISGDVSKSRNKLKKHRKVTHPTEVKSVKEIPCRNVYRNSDICWYKHVCKDNNRPQYEQSSHHIILPNQPQVLPQIA